MKKYKVVFPDMNGALRGKIVAEELFDITAGISLPRSALVADITGNEIEALSEFNIESGDTDMLLVPDPTTLIELPNTSDSSQVVADAYDRTGALISVAPRTMLRQILEKYQQEGYDIKVSSELEFYVYHKTGRQLTQLEVDAPYASINALNQHEALLDEIVDMTRQLGLKPEMMLAEAGQGQFEATFSPTDPLFMADRTTYFKQLVKDIVRKHELLATFLPKPFLEDDGSGGHIHLSVYRNGKNIFTDEKTLEHFVAGQVRYMRYIAALIAPNTNSYRRLSAAHGYVADKVSFSEESRNVGVRILGAGENRRIEYRLGGADVNVYIAFTAILAAGLKGIQNQWTYETPEVGDEVGQQLPQSLQAAIELFRNGEASELLGQDFIDVFSAVKDQEMSLFSDATIDQEVEAYGQQV